MIFLSFLFLLISGCGQDALQNSLERNNSLNLSVKILWGSCHQNEEHHVQAATCVEWYGEAYRNLNLQFSCEKNTEAHFVPDYCDHTSAQWVCVVLDSNESATITYYDPADWDRDTSKGNCTSRSQSAQWLSLKELHLTYSL